MENLVTRRVLSLSLSLGSNSLKQQKTPRFYNFRHEQALRCKNRNYYYYRKNHFEADFGAKSSLSERFLLEAFFLEI